MKSFSEWKINRTFHIMTSHYAIINLSVKEDTRTYYKHTLVTSMALVMSLKTLAVLAVLLQVYKVHTSCQDVSYSCPPHTCASPKHAQGRRQAKLWNEQWETPSLMWTLETEVGLRGFWEDHWPCGYGLANPVGHSQEPCALMSPYSCVTTISHRVYGLWA